MKIKTKLQLSAILSISITLVISLVLFWASREVGESIQRSTTIYQIVKNVSELNLKLNEFLLYHKEQTEAQWQQKHESLSKLLAELSVKSPDEQEILEEVRKNHKQAMLLFQKLIAGNREQRRDKNEIIGFLDLEEKVVDQLSRESQTMVRHSTRLLELSHSKVIQAQRIASTLVVVFTAIVTIVLAIILIMIGKVVVGPITKLKDATRVIASGHLNHKVDITSNDEIGQLAFAFNEMTGKLKDSYTALQDAFNQISHKLREARKLLDNKDQNA